MDLRGAAHARRSIDSACTGKPSARARAAPAGARRAAASRGQGYASHPPPERGRRERRLEASRAAGGQHVVRAGDVVAERGGRPRADEQAAGVPHPVRERLGLLADQLEVLRRDLLRRAERGRRVARLDQPRVRVRHARPLRREPLDLARRPRPAAPRPARSTRPGCPARARPAPSDRARSARDRPRRRPRPRRARSGPRCRRSRPGPTTCRFASCTYAFPGPTITSTACTDSVPNASAAIAWAPPIRYTSVTSQSTQAARITGCARPPGPGGAHTAISPHARGARRSRRPSRRSTGRAPARRARRPPRAAPGARRPRPCDLRGARPSRARHGPAPARRPCTFAIAVRRPREHVRLEHADRRLELVRRRRAAAPGRARRGRSAR